MIDGSNAGAKMLATKAEIVRSNNKRALKEQARMLRLKKQYLEQIDKAAEMGLTSYKQIAFVLGISTDQVKEYIENTPNLMERIERKSQKPLVNAKIALNKQLEYASQAEGFDEKIAKTATDYLKSRKDEDFGGITDEIPQQNVVALQINIDGKDITSRWGKVDGN